MADGITTARAVRSRGLHDIGGSTDPYRWRIRHVDIGENTHGRNGVTSFAGPDTYRQLADVDNAGSART